MLDAVRAEAFKLRRHRATWLMVWVYPIAITLLVVGSLIYGAARGPDPDAAETAGKWMRDSTLLWSVAQSPPGRFLIAGFAAVVFAGEYGWNTWKLIIPARARWQLIAAKWTIAVGFLCAAFVAATLILLGGAWLATLVGARIPEGVTIAALANVHAVAAGKALMVIVYTVAFAGLFAVLSQSILATVILSIGMVVIEGLLPLIGVILYPYLPQLTALLVEVLPFYHMANLARWSGTTGAVVPLSPDTIISLSWATSFTAWCAWVGGAALVTQLRFGRQDLN